MSIKIVELEKTPKTLLEKILNMVLLDSRQKTTSEFDSKKYTMRLNEYGKTILENIDPSKEWFFKNNPQKLYSDMK